MAGRSYLKMDPVFEKILDKEVKKFLSIKKGTKSILIFMNFNTDFL